jgi:signal transduction histidine kinase
LIIDDSVELIKVSLPSNISMDCHYEACACSIECNSTELDQLLVNLCVNAKDAMPNGGKITLRLDELHLDQAMIASMLLKSNSALPGRYARFTFEDTGTGIDDEHLDRIFDPFFTTKPPEKGSGLGLSIVAGIVKGHRGLLHIRSRKDVGTTFEVYFPVLSGTKTDEQ